MTQETMYTNGIAAFVNLAETEQYMGQDTGCYAITLTLEDDEASVLEGMGIKLKEYNGKKQRKFKSKYDVTLVDEDNESMHPKDLTWGSKVRVKWKPGMPHPQHGVAPYLNAVKVLELQEVESGDDEF